MPRSQTSLDAKSTLRDALRATAVRLAPGDGIPDPRHLSLLSEVEPYDPPRVWTDENARALAAMFVARARRDALSGGAALVSRYFDGVRLIRPAALSMQTRSLLLAAVGEYCCAIGWPQLAARFGDESLLFADTAALRYYALSVAALGHALNGEYVTATTELRAANDLFREGGWDPAESAYILLLADSLISSAHMDADRLAGVVRELTAVSPGDAYLDYSARAIEVMRQLIRGDHAEGLAASWQLLHGSQRHTSHRLIREFLLCIRSDIMLAQGQHAEALASLATAQSPEGHGICFAMQRTTALLLLGRDRDVLTETESCVASEADHCLRTLTPVLLNRAVAFHRLGNDRRALQSIESALLLISRTGNSMTPFIMVPREEAAELVDAAVRVHPELCAIANEVHAALERVGAPGAPSIVAGELPGLTPTERALADLLVTPLSLAGIARERGVSLNTVKSQVRSIYLKLGVGGRAEAVERLRRDVA